LIGQESQVYVDV